MSNKSFSAPPMGRYQSHICRIVFIWEIALLMDHPPQLRPGTRKIDNVPYYQQVINKFGNNAYPLKFYFKNSVRSSQEYLFGTKNSQFVFYIFHKFKPLIPVEKKQCIYRLYFNPLIFMNTALYIFFTPYCLITFDIPGK